jgi:hypothetical protein
MDLKPHDIRIRIYDSRKDTVPPDVDNAIQELLDQNDFSGNIGLKYNRRPSSWSSFLCEGDYVLLFTAWNKTGNKLLGIGAAVSNMVWVDHKEMNVVYLFSFRITREEPSAVFITPEAYRMVMEMFPSSIIYLTTILEENQLARQFLEKPRKSMPVYHFITPLVTTCILCWSRASLAARTCSLGWSRASLAARTCSLGWSRASLAARTCSLGWSLLRPNVNWHMAVQADKQALTAFLREEGSKIPNFPVFTADSFKEDHFPGIEDFIMIKDRNNEIIACAALWNQQNYKQYTVFSYSPLFSLLRPLSKWIFPLFNLPPLPPTGTQLNFFTASFYLVKDKNPKIFRTLLQVIKHVGRNYDYFLIASPESSEYYKLLRGMSGIRYKSRIYQVYPRGTDTDNRDLFPLSYLELGRL